MERAITGYRRDDEGHWVAVLSCGHGQHLRHNPPFTERPWVLSEAGRSARLGTPLDCPLCDTRTMPDGHAPYRRTPVFDETSIPTALTTRHSTKAGVWGRIHVESGEIRYRIPRDGTDERLRPGRPGTVMAEEEHYLEITGPVRVAVEFWRAEDSGP